MDNSQIVQVLQPVRDLIENVREVFLATLGQVPMKMWLFNYVG
jgi:hypothetical protein